MEFKGEDFVKKVQIKQEKETLKLRLQDLEEQDIPKEPIPNLKINLNEDIIDLPEQELGDILLANTVEPADKKKYIILGLVLVVLFLITIVVIRLVTNSSDDTNDSFVDKKENISQDKVLNDENIEQQYQKIISQKMKKLQEEKKAHIDLDNKKAQDALNIKKVQKEEIKTVKPNDIKKEEQTKEIKKDLLTLKEDVKKESPKIVKPIMKKIVKLIKKVKKIVKKVAKKPVKKEVKKVVNKSWPVKKQTLREPTVTDFTKSQTANKLQSPKKVVALTGYFVQIGAFTKQPSKAYLSKVKNAGFSYKMHNETIKGKAYIKVLIGPYPNRAIATKNMPTIKSKIGLSSAFIKKL